MKIIVLGATGMVGHGVLHECLLAGDVSEVLIIGRTPSGMTHDRLREINLPDMSSYSEIEGWLRGYDACFFCLGTSSLGKSEAVYTHITEELTIAAATTLSRLNPDMVFTYVSGAGTDSSERARTMWARVKGRTENRLLKMGFKGAYMFRPGAIEATHGARSKTLLYSAIYAIFKMLLPPLRRLFPNYILTTAQIGQAMLAVARHGAAKNILETTDIRLLAEPASKVA